MKKTVIITAAIIAAFIAVVQPADAQDKPQTDAQLDLVSKYLWRGLEKGGISLQSQASVSWQGLHVGLSGSKGFSSDDAEELDIEIGYKLPYGFNVGVKDYWQTGIEPNNIYFEYGKETTAHRIEGNLGYTCKYGSVQAYCMFYGHDFKVNGEQAYSTYIELSVPFRFSELQWTATAGLTPMESAGTTIYNDLGYIRNYTYADGPALVLASLRATKDLNLHLRNVKASVYAELSTNPYLRTAHFIGGFKLSTGRYGRPSSRGKAARGRE